MPTERIDIVVSERGARRVKRKIDAIGTAARKAKSGVSLLRSALGLLSGALILRGVVGVLAKFSQSMATLKAVTQATGEEFARLDKKAQELGISTRFSATQAADAMVFLARTGFNVNEVLDTIAGTLNLAQIGLIEVSRAADISSNVLKGFRLETDEMTRVIDVLAITSVKANVTVESLGDAMSFAASAAASLGVSVEDTAAAIGVLGDRAIPASRAGAGLNLVFGKLVKFVGDAQVALDRLKLSQADVDIQTRGFIPVIETLAEKNIDLRDAIDLVGVRQAKVLLILADSVKRLKELRKTYKDATITADGLSRIMDDNLLGALIRVRSATEGIIIAWGKLGGEGFLRNALEGLVDILRAVARNIDNVTDAVTVLLALAIPKFLRIVTGAVIALGVAILTNPIGALGTVLVTATAALVAFQDEVKLTEDGAVTFRDAWEGAGDALGDTFVTILQDAGVEVEDFGDIALIVTKAVAKAFVFMVSIINGALNTLPKATSRFELGFKSLAFLLNTEINKALELLNEQLRGLGGKPIPLFQLKALRDEIMALKGDLVDADKTFSLLFAEGFNAVDDAIAGASEQRRLLAFFNKNVRRKPEFGGTDDDEEKGGKKGKPKAADEGLRNALKDLEASVNPALAALDNLSKAQDIVNKAVLDGAPLRITQVELLKRVRRQFLGLPPTLEQVKEAMDALTEAEKEGIITKTEQIRLTRQARLAFLETEKTFTAGAERALLRLKLDSEDLAVGIDKALTTAFNDAGDALADFVTTGKLDFASLIDSFIKDLARLAIQGAIIKPLAGLLGGTGSGIGNESGGLQGLFDGLFGGGSGPGPLPAAASFAEFIPGFRHGGTATVGGPGGVDQSVVQFRATRGEEVEVKTPGQQQRAPQNITQIWNIKSPDIGGFNRSQPQIMSQAGGAIQRQTGKG